MTTIQRDYYKVLQVDPEASPEVITAAFRVLARRLHPDRDLTGVHEIRMSELNRAYGVLRDLDKRRDYDLDRALRLSPMGPGFPEEIDAPVPVSQPRGTSVDGTPDGDAMLSGWAGRTGSVSADSSRPPMFSPGDTRLNFGRWAGWSLRDIARQDVTYLRWLARHSSGIRFRGEIAKVLGEPLDDPYAS